MGHWSKQLTLNRVIPRSKHDAQLGVAIMNMKAVLFLVMALVATRAYSSGDIKDPDINPHPSYCTDRCDGVSCGCHNRYCWTKCIMGWCYTKGEFRHSQNLIYVPCEKHNECCYGWSCAGSCTL